MGCFSGSGLRLTVHDAINFAIAIRDWLADFNRYISAVAGLVLMFWFIRQARKFHGRDPPAGAMGLVLFEGVTFIGLCISIVRILTGAFHDVMHAEEFLCFFVGSTIIAYMLYKKLSHAFEFAGTTLEPGDEPNTEDFWAPRRQ